MQQAVVRPMTSWPLRLLLPIGMLVLVLGVLGGLARVGVLEMLALHPAVSWHGPLLVFGFFGTLIATERAVALRRAWGYAAPLASIAGALALLVGLGVDAAALLWMLAGLVALMVGVMLHRRRGTSSTQLMLISYIAWVVGAVGWGRGWMLESLLPWWVLMLVAMIVGERVQFERLNKSTSAHVALLGASGAAVAAAIGITYPGVGVRISGSAFAVIAAWFLTRDVRTQSWRAGRPRFITSGSVLAYAWLLGTSLTWIGAGAPLSASVYDLAIHGCFLGFAMGMVFAHAPIAFPAMIGLRLPFVRAFWIPVLLLQAGLVVRAIGAMRLSASLVRCGALITAAAVIVFLLLTAAVVLLARIRPHAFALGRLRDRVGT